MLDFVKQLRVFFVVRKAVPWNKNIIEWQFLIQNANNSTTYLDKEDCEEEIKDFEQMKEIRGFNKINKEGAADLVDLPGGILIEEFKITPQIRIGIRIRISNQHRQGVAMKNLKLVKSRVKNLKSTGLR